MMYQWLSNNEGRIRKKIQNRFNSNRIRLTRYDELNNNVSDVKQSIATLYRRLTQDNEQYFLDELKSITGITDEALLKEHLALIGFSIAKFLDEYNKTLMYVYQNEWERKRDRYAEAIIASGATATSAAVRVCKQNKRYWITQTEETLADLEIAYFIALARFNGIEKVIWNTAEDEKVCKTCSELDGMIFRLEDVPQRPHINCRCWLERIE